MTLIFGKTLDAIHVFMKSFCLNYFVWIIFKMWKLIFRTETILSPGRASATATRTRPATERLKISPKRPTFYSTTLKEHIWPTDSPTPKKAAESSARWPRPKSLTSRKTKRKSWNMDSTPFSKTTRKINKNCFENRMDQLHQQTKFFKKYFEDQLKANWNAIV